VFEVFWLNNSLTAIIHGHIDFSTGTHYGANLPVILAETNYKI